jgi:hypothetical protein
MLMYVKKGGCLAVSLLYHNGSSLLVNFKNSGIINSTTIINVNSKSSAKFNDKSNITENGIVIIGSRTNKDVVFLEEEL